MQPNVEYVLAQDELTMTRFSKLPGVMDEMIDMAKIITMMFSNCKQVNKESNATIVVGYNSNEPGNLDK